MIDSFLKGFCAGLVFALPAGPAGILVLRSWIGFGAKRGLLSTLGMAFADGVVAASAAWGLHVASPVFRHSSGFLRLAAGILLIATGIGFLFFEKDEKQIERSGNPVWAFLWPAGLVFTNPGLWAAYSSLLLAMNTQTPKSIYAIITGMGASVGVVILWIGLGTAITLRKRSFVFDEARFTRGSDRITGYLLVAMGLFTIWP